MRTHIQHAGASWLCDADATCHQTSSLMSIQTSCAEQDNTAIVGIYHKRGNGADLSCTEKVAAGREQSTPLLLLDPGLVASI